MFSKIVCRTHMYLALVLTPWVLMYTVSTLAMNHRQFFRNFYGGNIVQYEQESARTYSTTFPADARPQAIAEQVLRDLGLDGTFTARKDSSGVVTIVRQDPVTPRRVVYKPSESKIVVEREVFRTPAFLERMHRHRGYQHPYALEDAWAFSVDLFILAMIFWVASGLWMWWELEVTRRLGALFALGGAGLFALFLLTI